MQNFSFGYAKFQIDEAAKGVLCYSIRNPEEDKEFISEDGYITDLKLIYAMSSYTAARELQILEPVVRYICFCFIMTVLTLVFSCVNTLISTDCVVYRKSDANAAHLIFCGAAP